jgi:hypothetical protein
VPSAGHCYVVDVFDVARVDGVYAIPYGSVDRVTGALGGGGESKDKHIEVEEYVSISLESNSLDRLLIFTYSDL